jgi:hypothetical protein
VGLRTCSMGCSAVFLAGVETLWGVLSAAGT